MNRHLAPWPVLGLLLALPACNQPFEPDGPSGDKLVVYGILNSSIDTQYVRLSTTYGTPPGSEIRDAVVTMLTPDRGYVAFRDTTILHINAQGNLEQLNVYVAYPCPVSPGSAYTLQASTSLNRQSAEAAIHASASTIALAPPALFLRNQSPPGREGLKPPVLLTSFQSLTGYCEIHLYLEFYALVDGGWELHSTEVARDAFVDGTGNEVLVYPGLVLVRSLAGSSVAVPVLFDTLQYSNAMAKAAEKFTAAPLAWLQGEFVVTQIDSVLYSYYYANNGPADLSSIRLDRPVYTNVANGFGVFGSCARVVRQFRIGN